jgi:hypothetical protein
MKKLLPIFCAFLLCSFASKAQSTVTFELDATDFLANGGVLGVSTGSQFFSIAGNFTASGATAVADWTPSAGPMTDAGNNLWTVTINFDGTATDSLNFKFVSGSDWPDGDEGGSWADATPDCKRPSDNNNRKFLVPATGTFTYHAKWGECPTPAAIRPVLQLSAGDVYPNPAQNVLSVRQSTANPLTAVRVVSAEGKVVLSQPIATTGNVNVNVSKLPVGMYSVMVYGKNTVSQKKFSVIR